MVKRKKRPLTYFSLCLPLFIHQETKAFWGIFAAIITAVAYMLSNHFHFFEPQMLLMTIYDQQIPFIPLSVWVYASEYIFFFIAYLYIKNTLNLNRLFYAFMSIQFISGVIFILLPTTYPRELFPLHIQNMDTFTFHLFQSIREADTPTNCCPSLHVSSVLICALAFLNEQQKKFPFMLFWALAIAFSTLTTKQHYIVDVLFGFLIAIGSHFFFHHHATYSHIQLLVQREEINSKKAS